LARDYDETWVELLIEVDADAFPKLASAIVSGEIDSVSMGADVEFTVCSVCDNEAKDVMQFCAHIPQQKGRMLERFDQRTGSKFKKLCYEDCFGVNFFEISFVFEPADESALISDTYLAPRAANRALSHVRQASEKIAAYSERVGMVKTADQSMMALPQPVNTLRDEMNCPQCAAEWDGVICQSCGFELPPEGLGDPNSGMAMQQQLLLKQMQQMLSSGMNSNDVFLRMQEAGVDPQMIQTLITILEQQMAAQGGGQAAPAEGTQEEGQPASDDSSSKAKSKKKKKKKSGYEGGLRVSRFDSFLKEATLPQDPQYVQDTSGNPGTQVGPYGTVEPTMIQGFEQALEPAPSAPAILQDLDAPDVQGPIGQSAVTAIQQQPGPVDSPPPGTAVGEQINVHAGATYGEPEEALRQQRVAEVVTQTDVRALDEPPAVNVGADATVNVLSPILQPNQLALADTTDVINDGSETGLPTGPNFRERLQQQFNPFNDAALMPYQPVSPQVVTSAAKCSGGCECSDGSCNCGSCSGKTASFSQSDLDTRVNAAKTRVLRIANFVDERIDMGLTEPNDKFTDVARFEEMDDSALDGYIQATREVKASELRTASKRVRVASSNDNDGATPRMPSLGSAPKISSIAEDLDIGDDYVAFL
jgi:hypothetical protein